jgi:small conductance mechanosensitive channel
VYAGNISMDAIIDHLISPRPYLTAEDIVFIRSGLLSFVPNILSAVAIIIGAFIFYKLTARPVRKLLTRSGFEEWLARIAAYNVYKLLIIIIATAAALGELGVHIGATLAGLGIASLAIGFIAQDSLSNIVAGFLISIDKPFRVGDYITLDKYYGRIELITMRSTRIRTQDNTYVVIPNQKIINDVVVDHTAGGDTRLVITVSIAYEASIEKARAAILAKVAQIEGVLGTPSPDVVVDKLGDSGVGLLVRVWIADASMERRIYFKTGEAVKQALDEAGIEIAYPHLKLVDKRGRA